MNLAKYSLGIGDRFARQGEAQLRAFVAARAAGTVITPVWNKSNREHQIVGTHPADVRAEADAAVRALGWTDDYRVDADHISLNNVAAFLDASDFFTLDVADFTGKPAPESDIRAFVGRHKAMTGTLSIPGLSAPMNIAPSAVESIARKYLLAVREAGRIYRRIVEARGQGSFVTEVSMDETDRPQTPLDLLFILAAIADEGIPARTLAPKFTGRFNKGVDYVGDVAEFEREFNDDLCVLGFAAREFKLPPDLKLSVHSGSDKFSLYAPIRRALRRHGAGLHLKTAGTTWLEELIGLATAGPDGLELVKELYAAALPRFDELSAPYATVIAIDRARLPAADDVRRWSGEALAAALTHEPGCPGFNPHMRQLMHVGYKVAAEMGARYLDALAAHAEPVARGVTNNILRRHIEPLFLAK